MPTGRGFLGGWVVVAVLLAIGLAIGQFAPAPTPVAGHATAVDGDTLRLGGERIRLLGLDAPERAQICEDAAGADWACGEAARTFLARQLAGAAVSCTPSGHDRYGRLLARCRAGETDLAAAVVAAGLAIPEGDYGREARAAQAAKAGIWAGRFTTPAAWRAAHDGGGENDLLSTLRAWFR